MGLLFRWQHMFPAYFCRPASVLTESGKMALTRMAESGLS